jgi:hypothetical protein
MLTAYLLLGATIFGALGRALGESGSSRAAARPPLAVSTIDAAQNT